VRFSSSEQNLLLVSSWDRFVRLYDTKKNAVRQKIEHKGAVLDCVFGEDEGKCFTAGLDKVLSVIDLRTGKKGTLGSHEKPIRCLEYSAPTGLVVTGSWDSNCSLWDSRAQKPLVGTFNQGNKVYSMDLRENRLVVATNGRKVNIYDVRNMSMPEQTRESSLLNQTRCVRVFPDATGFALSSIEGRVAYEYFDPSPQVQAKKYAFKCHRKAVDGVQTLYPVNTMAFHPKYGTFATGGCDGVINIWDGKNKKRICQYPAYPTSVSSLDFNSSGTLLAIASSYTFEEGDKPHPADAVLIRTINDHEVLPKKRGAK